MTQPKYFYIRKEAISMKVKLAEHETSQLNMLTETAISRVDAIDKCDQLGKMFVEHFHKVVKEGVYSSTFNHHCAEMQAWYDSARDITLKSSGKVITKTNLIDWFFSMGKHVEAVVEEEYVDTYEKFYIELLHSSISVKEAFEKVLPQ